jgi:RNA recognition motif-containing protein
MPQTSVYVRNLPEGTTEDELFKVFSAHGVVLAAQVKQEKD